MSDQTGYGYELDRSYCLSQLDSRVWKVPLGHDPEWSDKYFFEGYSGSCVVDLDSLTEEKMDERSFKKLSRLAGRTGAIDF